MLKWLSARSDRRRKADDLYGAVVAQARSPGLYAELGVPDTMGGRYEMIVVHLMLVLERLRSGGAEAETVSRMTLERFVTDMDDCMREIGVGDMSVPKRVKKAAAGFYERAHIYREILDKNDTAALSEALARYVYQDDEAAPGRGAMLAAYVQTAAMAAQDWSPQTVVDAQMAFPPASPPAPSST